MHPYDDNIQQTLDRIKVWYDVSGNPLYVWEAIHHCLTEAKPAPLPEWCVSYLRDTSGNMYQLYCGRDFRASTDHKPKISPEEAFKAVPQALGISRQGKKNAFQMSAEDRSKQSLAGSIGGRAALEAYQKQHYISEESARRHKALGNRFRRVKPKTST
jgi:hypothetical protein